MKQTTEHQMTPTTLETFLSEFEKVESPEGKLTACIDFMQHSLCQEKSPDFKGFWEARKLCFTFFKENLPAAVRLEMWNRYVDLTREGRRLKNLLDEESSFAVQQIDLAITALENEVKSPQEVSAALPKQPKALEGRYDYYETTQKELCRLNFFSSRINGLRKELIKTEMRIRHKNKFFQRLSALGDLIFPRRKELIKQLSDAFITDVSSFTESHFSPDTFSEDKVRRFVFFYREEIKTLQALAKQLTINTHAFTSTRQSLSECWDMLRGLEKELKKEHDHLKQQSSKNREEAEARIEQIAAKFAANELKVAEALGELKEVTQWMRQVELTKADLTHLRQKLALARAPMEQLENEELQRKKDRELEQELQRKEKIEQFKAALLQLGEAIKEGTPEKNQESFEALKVQFPDLPMNKAERQLLDRMMRDMRDRLAEKEQELVLALPEDAKEQLDILHKMLQERVDRRKEIKFQIEEYRKLLGGSNLDFEKAMKYNELMASEKKSLEKCDAVIIEIETKIKDIKNQS